MVRNVTGPKRAWSRPLGTPVTVPVAGLLSVEPFTHADAPLGREALEELLHVSHIFSPNRAEAASMLGRERRSAAEGASGAGEGFEEDVELTARLLDGGAPSVALRCGADGVPLSPKPCGTDDAPLNPKSCRADGVSFLPWPPSHAFQQLLPVLHHRISAPSAVQRLRWARPGASPWTEAIGGFNNLQVPGSCLKIQSNRYVHPLLLLLSPGASMVTGTHSCASIASQIRRLSSLT